jgi:hypothetical protein
MSQLSIYLRAVAPTARRLTAVVTAFSLVSSTLAYVPALAQQEQQQGQEPMQGAQALAPAQLDQLVAPVALYPDNLLGQVLSASTYPLEIVMAARWSASNPRVKGQQLEDAMQSQPWDPSVRALAAVPQVLKMMSEKLEWTQQLGEAYLSQPDDIAASVQRLRARADASGNLKTSEQVRVRRVAAEQPIAAIGPEYIVIEPVVPERIYVPVYDPFVAYGIWPYPTYSSFYWYPPGYVAVGVIGFGAAVVVGSALWATYNWNYGRVYANPVMYASFNKVSITQANALAAAPVKFDPGHRGPLGFKNQSLQTQYSKTAAGTPQNALGRTNSVGNSQNFLSNPGNSPKPANLLSSTGNGPKPGDKPGTTRIGTGNTVINNNSVTNNVTVNRSVTNKPTNIGNISGNNIGNNIGNNSGNKPPRTLTNNAAINTGKPIGGVNAAALSRMPATIPSRGPVAAARGPHPKGR